MNHAATSPATEAELKPSWRGWIHLGATPLALAAGIVLICVAPTALGKITSAIYALTGILLFGTSALYHRGNWSPGVKAILKRLDHTNIMLVIAGTYTPLSAMLLSPADATVLLWSIWAGSLAGVAFRLLWLNAPRWLYVPIYCLLGLGSLFYIPQFFAASVPAATLICCGGVFYIAGAVFYGFKRPRLSRTHFGFHEFFHAFTVAGFACHFMAIVFAVFRH
ncbi:PAQR family membrane homeostasis protein TrhA [Psychromicrobium xiongbiense]|uniref:PAQR family membrane homeostasis protein TrhA n=1 Tax=Psychromicrobium xiongbiense TaxID=3051184 RepID=UPI0025533535|nr:hemolysin III family protein [Psychromicrobium sp. YIM S02556]